MCGKTQIASYITLGRIIVFPARSENGAGILISEKCRIAELSEESPVGYIIDDITYLKAPQNSAQNGESAWLAALHDCAMAAPKKALFSFLSQHTKVLALAFDELIKETCKQDDIFSDVPMRIIRAPLYGALSQTYLHSAVKFVEHCSSVGDRHAELAEALRPLKIRFPLEPSDLERRILRYQAETLESTCKALMEIAGLLGPLLPEQINPKEIGKLRQVVIGHMLKLISGH